MSSLNHFPHEVLQKIACQLNKKDKLSSLTVCSALYPAILESLYKKVVIEDMVTFRYFLSSIAHHRHQPNYSVKSLSLLMDNYDVQYGTRLMTLTEFELLARYCVNLDELFFYESEYWKFMNELDFTIWWPRLIKIPASQGTKYSFYVYQKLKDRLEDINLCGQFDPHFNLMDLISPSERVQRLVIDDRRVSLDIKDVLQIHSSYCQLKTLVLYTKLLGVPVEYIKTKSIPKTKSLQSISCTIDHSNSPWFTLFKTWYKNIDSLYLRCLTDYSARPIKSFNIVESILDILHTTDIRQLQFTFINVQHFLLLAESVIMETIFDYIMWDIPATISLNFSYVDADISNRKSNELQCSLSTSKSSLQEFNMRYSLDNYHQQCNEISFLSEMIRKPINNLQLTHLTLTRTIILYANPMTKEPPRPLYIDSVLEQFPNLHSLTFTLSIQKRNLKRSKSPMYNNSTNLAIVTLANSKKTIISLHNQLVCLKIVSTKIDPSVYHYLFQKCPRLSTLVLVNCYLRDDETLLALEYLCLENDVDLIVIK